MSSSLQTSIHIRKNDKDVDKRIRTRSYNYDTWATANIEIDNHDITLFMHSPAMIREIAAKLTGLAHALFNIAHEQEVVAAAKEQSNLVG